MNMVNSHGFNHGEYGFNKHGELMQRMRFLRS